MSKVKTRTWQQSASEIVFEENDEEYRLDADITPVCEWIDPIMRRVGDKVVFAYAVVDENPGSPDEWDGEGKVIFMSSRHSSAKEQQEALDALGLDGDGYPQLYSIREELLAQWIGDDQQRHVKVALQAHMYQKPWNVHPDAWAVPSGWELISTYDAEGCANILWDFFSEWPDENSDDLLIEWHKFAIEEWNKRRAAGTIGTKYTQVCDVYEHSGIHVSLSNTRDYPDEQWDVARGGAVWIPDQCAIDNIDWPEYVAKDTPEEHAKRAWDYAKGCVETWNQYWSGDVYGHVIEVHQYNEEGEYGDDTRVSDVDSCWGHYGSDYMKEVLQDELEGEVNFLLKNGGAE